MKLFIKHGNVLIIDVDGVEAHDKYIVLYVRIKIDLKIYISIIGGYFLQRRVI